MVPNSAAMLKAISPTDMEKLTARKGRRSSSALSARCSRSCRSRNTSSATPPTANAIHIAAPEVGSAVVVPCPEPTWLRP